MGEKDNPNTSSLYKINIFFFHKSNYCVHECKPRTGLGASFASLCQHQPPGVMWEISFTVERMYKYIKTHPPTHDSAFLSFFLVLYFSTHSACVFSLSLYTVASPHNFPRQSITGKVFWFLGNSDTWSQQYIVSVDVIQRYGNIVDIQYIYMPQSIIDIQYNTIRLNSRLFSRRGFLMEKKTPIKMWLKKRRRRRGEKQVDVFLKPQGAMTSHKHGVAQDAFLYVNVNGLPK